MAEEEKEKVTKETTKRKRPRKSNKVTDANFEEKETEVSKEKKKEVKKEEVKKEKPKKEEKEEVKEPVKKPRKRKKSTPKKEETKAEVIEEAKEEVQEEQPVVEEVKEEAVEEPKEEVNEEVPEVVTPVQQTSVTAPVPPTVQVNQDVKSYFDGRFLEYVGWKILGFIVTVVTFGLGASFAKCFMLKWQYSHTIINGRRLDFDGNGFQLLGRSIMWGFFTIITLGIYSLWIPVQYNKWVVKHTHYEGNLKPVNNYSQFTGKTIQVFGLGILCGLLNLFSLGLLTPFTETLMFAWRIKHTIYDGNQMEFDGKGFQLLGNRIKWGFFTIITLGIYSFWIPINLIRWEVKHTNNKGVAKHPYNGLLGMILPIILVIAFVGGGIYGLTQVDEEQWTEIGEKVKDYIDEYIDEANVDFPGYEPVYGFARRVGDVFYMIRHNDFKIDWQDRYIMYFENSDFANKYGYNGFEKRGENDEAGVAIIDSKSSNDPIVIMKNGNTMTFYWIRGTKVENHFFTSEKSEPKLVIITNEKDKSTHLAVETISSSYAVNDRYYYNYYFVDNIADDAYHYSTAISEVSFTDKKADLAKKGYSIKDTEVDYVKVSFKAKKRFGYSTDISDAIDEYNDNGSFKIKAIETEKTEPVILEPEEETEEKEEKEEKKEVPEEPLEEKKEDPTNIKVGNNTLDFGVYKSSLTNNNGGTYTLKKDGTYSYSNPNYTKKGKKTNVSETGKYEVRNIVFEEDPDTGEAITKGWGICMESNSSTKHSSTCWQVTQKNTFQAVKYSNTWTLQK